MLISEERIKALAAQAVDDGFEPSDGDYDACMSSYSVEEAIRTAIREAGEAAAKTCEDLASALEGIRDEHGCITCSRAIRRKLE